MPIPFTSLSFSQWVLVSIAMIAFAGLVFAQKTGLAGASANREYGPYGLTIHPIPSAVQAMDLLPEQFGSFQSLPITGTLKDFKTIYTNGSHTIELSGTSSINLLPPSPAWAMLRGCLNKAAQRELEQDPSYYLTSGEGTIRLAWSHGYWFFDITASSQQALDEFMRVFPY
jgi:hypothetical protein